MKLVAIGKRRSRTTHIHDLEPWEFSRQGAFYAIEKGQDDYSSIAVGSHVEDLSLHGNFYVEILFSEDDMAQLLASYAHLAPTIASRAILKAQSILADTLERSAKEIGDQALVSLGLTSDKIDCEYVHAIDAITEAREDNNGG